MVEQTIAHYDNTLSLRPNRLGGCYNPLLSLSGKAISRSLISQSMQAILLEKLVAVFVLEKKLAIASYTKALEFRNGKCFRRVTEEG